MLLRVTIVVGPAGQVTVPCFHASIGSVHMHPVNRHKEHRCLEAAALTSCHVRLDVLGALTLRHTCLRIICMNTLPYPSCAARCHLQTASPI